MISPSTMSINSSGPLICGLPFFCTQLAEDICYNTTLTECQACDIGNGAVYLVFCILLGLVILVGNVLVVIIMAKYAKKSKGNTVKLSLAIADLLTAIHLIVILPYNFSWSINSSIKDIEEYIGTSQGSVAATAGGISYLIGYTASIYHLVYLAGLRLYSVQWPLRYKVFSNLKFKIGLATVWLLSVISSAVPALFTGVFTFTYFPSIFSYFLSPLMMASRNLSSYRSSISIIFSFTFVPYMFMVVLTILTIIFYQKQRVRSRILQRTPTTVCNKHDLAALKLLITMELGFTIILVPSIVVQALVLGGFFVCDDAPIPSAVAFWISAANGLANFIIYGALDREFQNGLKKIISESRSSSYAPSSKTTEPSHSQSTQPSSSPLTQPSIAHIS